MADKRENPLVTIGIVCYNGARYIDRCMASLASQEFRDFEIIVVDNQSKDQSVELLRKYSNITLIINPENTGFSGGNNQALAVARGQWYLMCNLDTVLEPDALAELVRAGQLDPTAGAIAPKILRMNKDGVIENPPLLDSTGVYITPYGRHHDRGSQQPDTGQFEVPEYVFGYTGAMVLLRRQMIDDTSLFGKFCDEDFFAFREDADNSWRMQLMGWKCLYQPRAVCYHERTVFEGNRETTSALINMHSTKNRFLLRISNMTRLVLFRTLVPAGVRDIGVLVYVLLRERTSLPGLYFVVRHFPRLWRKRREIQSRRRVPDEYIVSFFEYKPVSKPLDSEILKKIEDFPRRVPLGPLRNA